MKEERVGGGRKDNGIWSLLLYTESLPLQDTHILFRGLCYRWSHSCQQADFKGGISSCIRQVGPVQSQSSYELCDEERGTKGAETDMTGVEGLEAASLLWQWRKRVMSQGRGQPLEATKVKDEPPEGNTALLQFCF